MLFFNFKGWLHCPQQVAGNWRQFSTLSLFWSPTLFAPQLIRFYSSASELLHPSFQTPKDAPIWPLNKALPRGAWVSYLLDSPHQQQFWDDLKTIFAQLHPNTAYAMLFHPSSVHGMVTLGNSILVDRN